MDVPRVAGNGSDGEEAVTRGGGSWGKERLAGTAWLGGRGVGIDRVSMGPMWCRGTYFALSRGGATYELISP